MSEGHYVAIPFEYMTLAGLERAMDALRDAGVSPGDKITVMVNEGRGGIAFVSGDDFNDEGWEKIN